MHVHADSAGTWESPHFLYGPGTPHSSMQSTVVRFKRQYEKSKHAPCRSTREVRWHWSSLHGRCMTTSNWSKLSSAVRESLIAKCWKTTESKKIPSRLKRKKMMGKILCSFSCWVVRENCAGAGEEENGEKVEYGVEPSCACVRMVQFSKVHCVEQCAEPSLASPISWCSTFWRRVSRKSTWDKNRTSGEHLVAPVTKW